MAEKKTGYPDNNPKTKFGVKKVSLALNPPSAEIHMAKAFEDGADKYGPYNWRENEVAVMVYINAMKRHMAAFVDGENYSPDTAEKGNPVHHLAHVMACAAIILDAMECNVLIDDRPKAGAAPRLLSIKKE